ncbi:hypothetical protein D3C72_1757610 [compost metagenome]
MRFTGIGFEHSVADKAKTHTGNNGDLFDTPGKVQGGRQHLRRCLASAHHFQQAHDVGRAEEVQTDHVLRASGDGCNQVHIQG